MCKLCNLAPNVVKHDSSTLLHVNKWKVSNSVFANFVLAQVHKSVTLPSVFLMPIDGLHSPTHVSDRPHVTLNDSGYERRGTNWQWRHFAGLKLQVSSQFLHLYRAQCVNDIYRSVPHILLWKDKRAQWQDFGQFTKKRVWLATCAVKQSDFCSIFKLLSNVLCGHSACERHSWARPSESTAEHTFNFLEVFTTPH